MIELISARHDGVLSGKADLYLSCEKCGQLRTIAVNWREGNRYWEGACGGCGAGWRVRLERVRPVPVFSEE